MLDIMKVADEADMIVNGYAYSKCEIGFRVLNLNNPDRAVVFTMEGEVVETTMDDIEIGIVSDYLEKNRTLMED